MHATLLLTLGPLVAAAEPVSGLYATWTEDTIPAIVVQLESEDRVSLEGWTVALQGPSGERYQLQTDADGLAMRGFLRAGRWDLVVEDGYGTSRLVEVDLKPRQRADVTLWVSAETAEAPGPCLRAPVVDVRRASQGVVFRGGRFMAQRP